MIKELERFVIAVDLGSFTKASRKLKITQPALSLSIARLEKAIGRKLFKRIGKRLVLTSGGESLYQVGTKILQLWNTTKETYPQTGTSTTYAIGVFDNAALKLSKFFQRNLTNSHARFEVTIDRSRILLQGLANGVFDICISIIPEEKIAAANIILVKTFSETLIPVSGKQWREHIAKIPFILYNKSSESRHYIDKTFLKQSLAPNVVVESTDPGFMKELAMGSCGVALLPRNFVASELAQGKLTTQNFPFRVYRKVGVFVQKDGNVKEGNSIVQEILKNLS